MRRQTGTGYNYLLKTIEMDPEWWKKAKADIPGCAKFKKRPIQNEETLEAMFGNILNDETDHLNPLSSNPIIPQSQEQPIDVDNEFAVGEEEADDHAYHNTNVVVGNNEVDELSPPINNAKKRAKVVSGKQTKRSKSSTTAIIEEQVTKIAASAKSIAAKKLVEVTIEQVMDLVVACGAAVGSNEHYVASKLFVKKEQREMFMTIPNDKRFDWLHRNYNDMYGQ